MNPTDKRDKQIWQRISEVVLAIQSVLAPTKIQQSLRRFVQNEGSDDEKSGSDSETDAKHTVHAKLQPPTAPLAHHPARELTLSRKASAGVFDLIDNERSMASSSSSSSVSSSSSSTSSSTSTPIDPNSLIQDQINDKMNDVEQKKKGEKKKKEKKKRASNSEGKEAKKTKKSKKH